MIALLAVVALVLNYLGFRAHSQNVHPADALYQSLQLFALEGNLREPLPWQLNIGRYLAAGVSAYALIATVAALLRNQAQEVHVRALARNHIVIVGLGATGIVVARALRKKRHRVVAIEADGASSRIRVARREGIHVIVGDGTQPSVLRTARVDRARHVIVLTGDDSRNIEVLSCAQAVVDPARSATLHVALLEVSLWKELAQSQLSGRGTTAWTEFFNLHDRTSQALIAAAAVRHGADAFEHALVVGHGPLAARTAAHAVRTAVAHGRKPRLDLLRMDSRTAGPDLAALEPWCYDIAKINEVEQSSIDPASAPTIVFVCPEGGDAEAVGRAVVLARDLPRTEIFVAVYRDSAGRALEVVAASDRIHIVPAKLQALAHELIEGSAIETLARARHADYVTRERSRGVSPAENPSIADWSELPESLRESNRRFAESVGTTLAGLGLCLRPLNGPESEPDFDLPEDSLERLARGEHDRWVQALIADGWRAGDGPKDPERKRHPLLVPWEELDEAERDKDRDPFRALPVLLGKVGYEIAPPGPRDVEQVTAPKP